MFENEKERGRKIARLPVLEKKRLIAQLMFGERWQEAREALFTLMESWGVDEPILHETTNTLSESVTNEINSQNLGVYNREQS